MIEAIGRYGQGFKPAGYHEWRVPLLRMEVENTNKMLKDHKEPWRQHGCIIMSDGWRDRTKGFDNCFALP